ncbi:putative toxin-antitoxin system toxin component, PIN family [Ottowia sp.]|uniref:putative toxin-antitoxin system toxin component, PIN family n=1 Tax=Ottowia sp. TaxID=1898956 RepID=UPI0039E559BB
MRAERAVIDTNVLISAALSAQGAPARIVHLLLAHSRIVFSQESFGELETRLWKPKFDKYVSPERRRLLLHDLAAVADWVALPAPPRLAYSRDPDDDAFIHTALAAQAPWLISGDGDLLGVPPIEGLRILTPAQALAAWLGGT